MQYIQKKGGKIITFIVLGHLMQDSKTALPRHNREAISTNFQQYCFLNKTRKMTIPVDMATWTQESHKAPAMGEELQATDSC